MSLVADALKKAEASPEYGRKDGPVPKSYAWVYLLVLAGCASLVLLGIAQVRRQPETPIPPEPAPAVQEAPAPLPVLDASIPTPPLEIPMPEPSVPIPPMDPPVALNGILLSGDGRPLAVINQEVLQPGDRVRGMRVVQVNTDSVELQDKNGEMKTLKLRKED